MPSLYAFVPVLITTLLFLILIPGIPVKVLLIILSSSEIFGRKLCEVVNDGVKAKLYLMPDDVQVKMKDCMEKIVNKGKGGLLAIIL
jgi:hypothetical protein